MQEWATWGTQLLGDVARTYAQYEWNPNPNVIQAKAMAENGAYYLPGSRGGVAQQGAITVTSDILVLGGLALLFVFAMRAD